ncbi:hypothetical protein [Pontibacter harenae]|uniref:hypothetical protein n=1 Tax=Pontibacter harenae TaxID=2894083 RepID=UPI001E295BD5|nr:hypothetical protein [Pontibacter harenae]MCC9168780.1 hypothetical protein [Pontibacter harenae]
MRDRNKENNHTEHREGNNQQIGRDLYNKDKEMRQQSRDNNRDENARSWDEGNHFHTGPNERGAQDRDRNSYTKGGSSNSAYNQGQNAHLDDHYGSTQNSHYRNERDYINHGDRHTTDSHRQQGNAGGQQPGNFNEPVNPNDRPHREGPGSRSRYKETDYRYGSGSHNWYRENRYTPDEDRRAQNDDRGFFDRMGDGIRDTWNDIAHSDDPDYRSKSGSYGNDRDRQDHVSSRQRYGSEPFRDNKRGFDNGYNRSEDRGYEGGPRWADESDSGEDKNYNNTDRNQRYRR